MTKKQKKSNKEPTDRISVLCDPILHHIMSFMDMKDVLETCRLSTRWRSLWTSVPVLNFNMPPSYSRDIFVDRVLHGHCKDSNLQRFCVSCNYYTGRNDLDYWIRIAVERHVQEIYLVLNRSHIREIPNIIFTSDIKIFKLITACDRLMTPASMGLARQLQSLELQNSYILNNETSGEVAISCPVLENLKLSNCRFSSSNILRISAPQLKSLFIKQHISDDVYEKKLIISCCKLESLVLKGTPFRKYVLRNLGSLVNADVQFDQPIKSRKLIKILKRLYNAESLLLSCQLQESVNDVNWCLPSFLNLRRLNLFDLSDGPCIHMVHNLLANCPRLETLIVGIYQMTNKEKDYSELSQCISSLKYFEIQGIEGRESEMEFFEFVLKTAGVLESFVLSTTETFLQNTLKERAKFQTKVHTLPRASLSVQTLFQTQC